MTPEQPGDTASRTGYQPAPTFAEMNRDLLRQDAQWAPVSACPACSSSVIAKFAELRSIEHSRCKECGFVFANPVPPGSVTAEFYNSAAYNNYRRLEEARQEHDRYFSLSAYTDQRSLASWLMTTSKAASVLDFGCGTGNFLALLRDEYAVPVVEGLELNEDSVQIARRSYGLELATAPERLRQRHYDAAVLLEVIEHISDVKSIVRQLAEYVRVGGYLLVTTPSVDGFVARRMPSQCSHYTAPSHVSLFTKRSMCHLLASSGFEPIEVRVDLSPMPFLAALRSLFYDLDFASPAHDHDTEDHWFRPTPLGRRLGCPEGRTPRLPFRLGGVTARTDHIAELMLDRYFASARKPDHLYVMARKVS
jgi:2-polyprenyl-3-methyl-5-hydroxy-6-metoxy-1,4-benzoquinol methylase